MNCDLTQSNNLLLAIVGRPSKAQLIQMQIVLQQCHGYSPP